MCEYVYTYCAHVYTYCAHITALYLLFIYIYILGAVLSVDEYETESAIEGIPDKDISRRRVQALTDRLHCAEG